MTEGGLVRSGTVSVCDGVGGDGGCACALRNRGASAAIAAAAPILNAISRRVIRIAPVSYCGLKIHLQDVAAGCINRTDAMSRAFNVRSECDRGA